MVVSRVTWLTKVMNELNLINFSIDCGIAGLFDCD